MLEPIQLHEVPAVVSLMNQAYRGTGAVKSWNAEEGLIKGTRTTEDLLREEITTKPQGTMLTWKYEGTLQGCVWVEPAAEGTWYLGSLAVDPAAQQTGLGKTILLAAEDWIREHGGTRVQMTVLSVRESLLQWYSRRGYAPTGERKPFPRGDDRFGVPMRDDLEFLVLEKTLD